MAMKKKAALYGMVILMLYTNFIMFQASCHVARRLLYTRPWYVVCNLLLLSAFYLVMVSFSPSSWVAGIIFSTICMVVAVVNDYVYALHGQVFTLAEISNAKTALHVFDTSLFGKKIPLIFGAVILVLYAFNIILCYLQKKTAATETKALNKKTFVYRIFFLIAGVCLLWGMSFPAKNLQDVILRDWTSRNTCIEEGYPMYVYANVFLNEIKVTQPDGYNVELLEDYCDYQVENKNAVHRQETPDIILILNESFYDLSVLSELQTDLPYLENYYNLDNAVRGYATTSVVGGATNRSEFELLTSNTNYLLGELTPFNALDMSCTSSIVTNLKECGYYTMAGHPADGGNYNRIESYSRMGFDERLFLEDFEDYAHYGSREWMTDEGAYHNLTAWYESRKADHDKIFTYLLTMQNHGDYMRNDEEEALIHVSGYDGDIERELNEYLSCIHLSDIAFKELTEYYARQEHPVILCMVGDHAPNFVREIAEIDSPEKEILARATPFIIWANYDIEKEDMGVISINGLVPLLLEKAGVDMLPYYHYINQMREKVPVTGSFGMVMDAAGNISSYYDDTEYADMIWKYLYLSYNNLQEESVGGWFHLEK